MGMFYKRLGRDAATASRYCDLLYTYIQDALIVFHDIVADIMVSEREVMCVLDTCITSYVM